MPKPKLHHIHDQRGASLLMILPLACLLAACGPNYSPDTYSSNAVQQANKVDSGVVVGVRKVAIRADSTVATATGGAAGGIAGSQVASGAVSALGALGGAVVGGVVGSGVGHNLDDTFGFEYIIRKANGDLLSVTQKDSKPLEIGQKVLIIQGSQARIVGDYTVPVDPTPSHASETLPSPKPVEPASKAASTPTAAASPQPDEQSSTDPVVTVTPIGPVPSAASPQPDEQSSIAPAGIVTPAGVLPAAASPQPDEQPASTPASTPSAPASPQPGEKSSSAPAATQASTPPAAATPEPGAQSSTTSPTSTTSNPTAGVKAPDAPQSNEGQPNANSAPVTHGPGAAH